MNDEETFAYPGFMPIVYSLPVVGGPMMILLPAIAAALAATALFAGCRFAAGRVRHYRRSDRLARQRLQLLRKLLRLAYVHGPDPALFLSRFREEVNIGHLEDYEVICGDVGQRRLDAARLENLPVAERDVLLCSLLENGFTPQELCVLYGMENCNSIYVRRSRIRKQCRQVRPDDAMPAVNLD